MYGMSPKKKNWTLLAKCLHLNPSKKAPKDRVRGPYTQTNKNHEDHKKQTMKTTKKILGARTEEINVTPYNKSVTCTHIVEFANKRFSC
jgi:hypothetical protein